ncbi:uncharacterized protein LOC125420913 [Ziziphus jujuba]|uniref:Uncharacterized protein LOC125420913 n=1 Tax=Ziziphus jujuba TaxID=326968 RepID=A0ABM4A0Y2_ZIZJJ|nr:uncharacterized protein LOC125420913 [Ziziphus jujuba]
MIGQLPKDFKSIKILNTLQDHVRGQQTQKHDHNLVPALSLSSININGKKSKESTARASSKSWRSKCQRYIGKYDVDWVKDKSGALMIVAAVIATITFQTAVNPPGGVWHQDINTTVFGPYCGNGGADTCVVGTAVLAHIWEDDYMLFMACKSIAFLASLSIIFLLLTGFPVKYRPLMWLLNFALCRRSDLYVTYLHAILYLVSPFSIDHRKLRGKFKSCRWTWIMTKRTTSGRQKQYVPNTATPQRHPVSALRPTPYVSSSQDIYKASLRHRSLKPMPSGAQK